MRKGDYVQYIGPDPLGYVKHDPACGGLTFQVVKRYYDSIVVYFPMQYYRGGIHPCRMALPARDFVKIKRG